MTAQETINKTMDRSDLTTDRARALIYELNELITLLRSRNLDISSWYGRFTVPAYMRGFERLNRGYDYNGEGMSIDDATFPWFEYWEIIWILLNNTFTKGMSVLDLGGSSSLFSYYLASKGLDVTTVDLQRKLVGNGNRVAREMGWKLENHVMDMRAIRFDRKFDHITSICVFEHVPLYGRIAINRTVGELLATGGRFSITFDFRNPTFTARIETPEDVTRQFVEPSGLRVRGNQVFADNGKSYLLHPFYHRRYIWRYKVLFTLMGHFKPREFFTTKKENDYTFGALFMEK